MLFVLGRKWFDGFLRRHPSITIRKPEKISSASAKVSEADIRGWFTKISLYFDENNLTHILSDPRRIFNGDETSFYLHPTTKAVLASRGNRNVYEVEHANSHQNITVLFTFAADGSVVPPNIVVPMKRIPADVLRSFHRDWGVGKSDKGWMDIPNFEAYIERVFHPFLVKNSVDLPVIFFVDGHSSHTAVSVADLCLNLGIILVALYPNTTRITQPADVAIFKPLKDSWKSAVMDWKNEEVNDGQTLTLAHFGPVLRSAMDKGIKKESIVNGFRVCGLYPFNVENVDFSKCVAKKSSTVPLVSHTTANDEAAALVVNALPVPDNIIPLENHSMQRVEDVPIMLLSPMHVAESVIIPWTTINEALQCIGSARINQITSTTDLSEEQQVIRTLYDKLLKPFHYQNPQTVEIGNQNGNQASNNISNGSELAELTAGTIQNDVLHT